MSKIIICLILIIQIVFAANVEEKIQQYFKSAVFKSYQKHWQVHRRSYENAIANALKENYGFRGMNVFVRRSVDMLKISKGFFVSDNVIDVLLQEMTLSSLPLLTRPEVTFALASNVLRIESGLSRIIIESNYILFRNQSDVVFDTSSDKHSPFSYQQVESKGRLAIIADQCSLVGYALVKLSGQSVNLGHHTFQVNDCKFSVEISSSHFGTPPVIASYFSGEQAKALEIKLSKPIIDEMLLKLQATIFSVLNTSVIFDSFLSKCRNYEHNIINETDNYVTKMVKNINTETVKENQVTKKLPQFSEYFNIKCEEGSCGNYLLIDNVTLYGLDTLYSSHTGGPFKLQSPKVVESLRFNSLTVRGIILYKNNTIQTENDFEAEIQDTAVNFEIDMQNLEPTFNVTQWRSIDISIIELENYFRDYRTADAMIHGYLSKELPKVLEDHLSRIYNINSSEQKSTTAVPIQCITEKATKE